MNFVTGNRTSGQPGWALRLMAFVVITLLGLPVHAQSVDLRVISLDAQENPFAASRISVSGAASTGGWRPAPYPVSPNVFTGPSGGLIDVSGLALISGVQFNQTGIVITDTDSVVVRSSGVTRFTGAAGAGMAITVILEPVSLTFDAKDESGVTQGSFRVRHRKTGEVNWGGYAVPPVTASFGPGDQVDIEALVTATGATQSGIGLTVANQDSITVQPPAPTRATARLLRAWLLSWSST